MSKKHDVLVINSYAGSLLLGASEIEGLKIRASMEDAGYGMHIQQANFPKLRYFEKYADWPKQDLSKTIVIAHPPCSAFSIQNRSADARGTDAKKFQCTKKVMEYAMKNKCAALAIESVPGALEGAREVHDKYAKKYGYVPFRILQNAITFGVPQWRPRFWILFFPKDSFRWLDIFHDPVYRNLNTILDKHPRENDRLEYVYDGFTKQKKHLLKNGFSKREVEGIFSGEYGFGPLQRILFRNFEERGFTDWRSCDDVCLFGTTFTSDCMMVANPEGYTNTILCGSFYTILGRAFSRSEYKRAAGFPASYKFPNDEAKKRFRCYLAQGVAPPVATWILRTVRYALGDGEAPGKHQRGMLGPGELIDLGISKSQWPWFRKDDRQMEMFSINECY